VGQLYQDLLGRPGDPQGLQALSGVLDAGGRRDNGCGNLSGQVPGTGRSRSKPPTRSICNRPGRSKRIDLFRDAVGRRRHCPTRFRATLLGSTEYAGRHDPGSVAFLQALFLDWVGAGRSTPRAETAFLASVAAGHSYSDVALIVITSPEARRRQLRVFTAICFIARPIPAGWRIGARRSNNRETTPRRSSGLTGLQRVFRAGDTRHAPVRVITFTSPANGFNDGDQRSPYRQRQRRSLGRGDSASPGRRRYTREGFLRRRGKLSVFDDTDLGRHNRRQTLVSFSAADVAATSPPNAACRSPSIQSGPTRRRAAGAGVQQMPSVAVDPLDPKHVAVGLHGHDAR